MKLSERWCCATWSPPSSRRSSTRLLPPWWRRSSCRCSPRFLIFFKKQLSPQSPCFHNVFQQHHASPYDLQCFLVTYTSTLSQEAFFNNVLFHELSHSLGPAFVGNDEANGEVVSWLSITWRTRNVLSVSSKQEGIRWKIIRCGLRWVPHTVGSRKVELYYSSLKEL